MISRLKVGSIGIEKDTVNENVTKPYGTSATFLEYSLSYKSDVVDALK